jgi:hypothetical protein
MMNKGLFLKSRWECIRKWGLPKLEDRKLHKPPTVTINPTSKSHIPKAKTLYLYCISQNASTEKQLFNNFLADIQFSNAYIKIEINAYRHHVHPDRR